MVETETRKHKNKLLEKWNGLDYYTNEILIKNEEYKILFPNKQLSLNEYQPTIDHKMSVKYCFLMKISPIKCGDIENLCITSRKTNREKHIKNEQEFKLLLNKDII